ncbi:hypothetical protein YC2023_098656 [Brassica napus]
MEEEEHGQALEATLSQHFAALQKLKNQTARMEKRNKSQGQRPHEGERRFGNAPGAVYVEPKPPDPSRINQTPTSKTHNSHVVNSRGYLRWERNLDEWFHYNNIQKKERMSYAIDQLKDDAFKWWVQEEDDRRRYPTHGSKEAKRMMPQQSNRSLIHQDQIRPNKRSTVLYDQYQPYEVPKAMGKTNFVSQDTLARHKEKSDKPISQEKAKNVKTGPEVQEDTISTSLLRSKVVHDFKPKERRAIKPIGEEAPGATLVMNQDKVQDTKLSKLLKEAKPVKNVSHQGKCLTPPRDTSADMCVLGTGSKNEGHMLTEVARKEPDHKLSHKPPHKWKPKSEQWIVQIPKPMNVEIISGCKEESFKEIPPDNLLLLGESTLRETRNENPFRGRKFFKGEGMMRPSDQQLNQKSTKLSKPTTLEIPAIEESLQQLMAKEQRPYSSSKPFRDISGRPLDLSKHLDLSRLLSIESCGVLNPPSFHSNSFAKLESDTHPASKAPYQSTSIIN